MINQDLQREAERYAEYQREQEAYEQAQYDDELSKAHEHIRTLEAQLARVRELPRKWCPLGIGYYSDFEIGKMKCADELEAALQSAEGPGSNQPELDNPKSDG